MRHTFVQGLPVWHCHSLLQEGSVAEPCDSQRELQHILTTIIH